MIKKIIFSFIISIVGILFVAQYDPWVHETCALFVCKYIERGSACKVLCTPKAVRFFMPEITLDDVAITSTHGPDWQWKAKRLTVSFSWWHFIRYRRIDIIIQLYECHVESHVVNNSLAIFPHLNQFFAASSLPVASSVKLIELHESSVSIDDKKNDLRAACFFSSTSKEMNGVFKTIVTISDGSCTVGDRLLVSHIAGIASVGAPFFVSVPMGKVTVGGHIEVRIELPHLDKPICFVVGNWENGSGRFSLRHIEQVCTIDPCIISTNAQGVKIDIASRFPLSYLWNMVSGRESRHAFTGNCLVRVRGGIGATGDLKGQLVIEDVMYKNHQLSSAFKVTLHKMKSLLTGEMRAYLKDVEIGGSWRLNGDTGAGSLTLNNARRCGVPGLPYWHLDANGFMGSIARHNDGSYVASYQCKAQSSMHNMSFASQGVASSLHDDFTMQGSVNDCIYKGSGFLNKTPYVDNFQLSSASGESLIAIQGADNSAWTGAISSSFMRSLLHSVAGFELQGKGMMHFDARYNNNQVHAGIHLKDGIIRLPYTYNFVDSFDMQLLWDIGTRAVCVHNLQCGLHTGKAYCYLGQLQFDSDYSLASMHVPLVFNRCLFNIKKDVFAMMSGHWLLSKKQAEPICLGGHIIIDRAHIKDTLFSLDISRALSADTGAVFKSLYSSIGLGIKIETKDHVRIDTSLLQAHAAVQVDVAGSLAKPTLEGDIVLDSGSIMLPYKSLPIIKGRIHFEPENTFNPTVELRARNKIKKYLVTLYSQGVLNDHQVLLDSNPPLTEEQIVALLLVGSPEESLNAMMPALLMHNLKMALFGSGSVSFLDNYFKRVPVPFSINLVPSFTDQTGRGGLRGGLEITVNDRWRALIQKNFSLSEDTRFELEYLFSDDLGVRAIRDERRDIGGEVEMRWKF
ncbi:MAG: translocation/assembly module TamB domain-containing protein [Candidatus Dependentiae bacterium]|nr:translocation/assembly module TamB domain-containing protein [Candidatus Dependentiae bacterium]